MKPYLIFLFFVLSLCAEEIKITGAIPSPKTYSIKSIRALTEPISLKEAIYCASGELRAPKSDYEGISLKRLLLDAGMTNQRRPGNRTYVLIMAKDGFKALFSWAEIMQEEESPIILVFSKNQKPLDKKHGTFRLIARTDQKNGTRSIFDIEQIRIQELEPQKHDFSTDLQLTGKIMESSLSLSEIQSMPVSAIQDLIVTNSSDEFKEKIALLEGVSLQELLQRYQITKANRVGNQTMIVLHASDGYQVLYSWHELMNRTSPNHALIAYQRNHVPLSDTQGPLMGISRQNNGRASRQIRWLKAIEVREVH